jgi:hypothetical protein
VLGVPVIVVRHGHVGVLNTHEYLVIFCLAKINGIILQYFRERTSVDQSIFKA